LEVFDDVLPVIGPYAEPPVACRDFDPQAAELARHVVGLISPHLPEMRVEHVGSTAVPGCHGSGIVDLLIACTDQDLENACLLLARLGFEQGGEALFPSCPPPFRGALEHKGDTYLLHVHALPASADVVDSIRFLRSCLRSDGELTRAYIQHKRSILSKGVAEPAEYGRQKAEFLKLVLG
jgi:GrpB-like predicted nucleotidyltransferase (UPF0157 family)